MQTLIRKQTSFRFSRYLVATAIWFGLLAQPLLDLRATEPDGPEFKFDPNKALVFKPNPKQAGVQLYTSLSSDGKMRAESGYRRVRVFSVSDNKLLYEFATPNQAMAAAFSPDLKTVAFVDSDNLSSCSDIYIGELETGKQSKIGSCLGSIMWLTFSGDGKRLAGVSIYGPIPGVLARKRFKRALGGEVTVFDVSTHNDLLTVAYIVPERLTPENGDKVLPYLPTHIALDHEGSTLVLASTSGLIKLIDVETGDNTISIELTESAKPTDPQPSLATAPFDSDQAKKHQQAWADYLGLPVEYTNSIGMRMVLIPAGEFRMGGGKSPDEIVRTFEHANYAKEFTDEHPQHRVRISKPFYLSTTEVTECQWESVMGTRPWTRPWKGEGLVKERTNCAATYVNWKDAQEFCRKLSVKEAVVYRLPTEAEWEYSCRAGTTSVFHFGDDVKHLGDYAWFNDNACGVGQKYVPEVGRKKPNPFGLYDMHGNLSEWCKDLYGKEYYAKSPVIDPQGSKAGGRRVSRGGSWGSTATRCRSADRFWILSTGGGKFQGFRVARSLRSADPERVRRQREEQAEFEERRRKAEQEFDEAFNQGDWIESNEESMLRQIFN